jgi:hypothetical protein
VKPVYNLRADHLSLIAREHVRHSLRSGTGVVFLVLAMIAGLALASIVVYPVESVDKFGDRHAVAGVTKQLDHVVSNWGPQILRMFTSATSEQSQHWLRDEPPLVSLFLILLIAFLPFLVALGAFNQTSGDIGSKGLRYLLLRTERSNIFLGRLIGTYLFTLVVIAMIVAVVTLYLVVKARFYPTGDVLRWSLHGLVACAIYALPWVTVCALVSTAVPLPFVSLVVVEVGILAWMLTLYAVGVNIQAFADYGPYITPLGWKWWLIDPSVGRCLVGGGAMIGFAAVATWLGLRTFNRRDL